MAIGKMAHWDVCSMRSVEYGMPRLKSIILEEFRPSLSFCLILVYTVSLIIIVKKISQKY